MSEHTILLDADFDPNVKKYWLWSNIIVFVLLIVTIPIAIVIYFVAGFFIDKYLANLSCTLTDRTLDIKKGILNKTESTIPLEKITDLQLFQGPIMRFFGIHGFKVETAGQSSGVGSLVNIKGIVDTPEFRKAVLAQRDRLHDGESSSGSSSPTTQTSSTVSNEEQTEILREIRDSMARIETHLKGPHGP